MFLSFHGYENIIAHCNINNNTRRTLQSRILSLQWIVPDNIFLTAAMRSDPAGL